MTVVRAKKQLGQHFLKDKNIAQKIVESLESDCSKVLEIGPGMGVLTQFLFQNSSYKTIALDVDRESIDYLKRNYPEFEEQIQFGDFLKADLKEYFDDNNQLAVIGNFPYNISSQIFFKILDYKDNIPEAVGMIQKEVAERLASPPGNKQYGILSVLLQAYYDIEYLFTVHEQVFIPPPKVKSAVIRLKRNAVRQLGCDEQLFRKVVKAAFNQRRKMLRNSLKPFIQPDAFEYPFMQKRPEQLTVNEFIELTNAISGVKN